MTIKIVAFYTNNFYYSKSIDLSHSLNKWGCCYEIKKIQGPKTWQEAVSHKPQFILDSLLSSTCAGILYTDVDSKLQRDVPYDTLTGDMAYVPFKRSPHHEEEALTGTLYFKNTQAVHELIRQWIAATPKYQHTFTPEQCSLKEVLAATHLDIQRLGPEWCWIFDDFKELFPNASPPIFEHYQASREYKEREAQGKTEMPDMQGQGLSGGYLVSGQEWTSSKGRAK